MLVFVREHVSTTGARTWYAVSDVGRDVSFRDLEFVLARMSAITSWRERRLAVRLEGDFQIRNLSTGTRTAFSVVYGIDGKLSAVPLQIVFRPRWWLRTELTLDPDPPLARGGRPSDQPVNSSAPF